MHVATFRFIAVIMLVLLGVMPSMVAASPLPTTGVAIAPVLVQDTSADQFFAALSARDTQAPLSGPYAGDLLQSAQFASAIPAGVNLAEFIATVTIQNPQDDSRNWDFGFDFGKTDTTSERVLVESSGRWIHAPHPGGIVDEGPLPGLDSSPGATNTLDLVVVGANAMIGINGQYAATIPLAAPVASDVRFITGTFDETTVDGRSMRYDDFAVWSLTESGEVPSTGTLAGSDGKAFEPQQQPAQPGAAANNSSQPVPQTDQEMYEGVRALVNGVAPIAGPVADVLVEEEGMLSAYGAGVTIDNFQATADFTVPAGMAQTPWDAGFIFGDQATAGVRVAVDSLGNWYTSVGGEAATESGPVSNLATRPGDRNTLELFVMGDQALLAVNGLAAARFTLPILPGAGDVGVGAGFYANDIVAGRVTEFQNFTVRPFVLDPAAPPVSMPQDAVVAPDQGSIVPPEPIAATGAVDARTAQLFTQMLTDLQQALPNEGPSSAQLIEQGNGRATTLAGPMTPDAENFAAVITLINPEDMSTPWTAGIQFRSDARQTEQVVLAATGHVIAVHTGGVTDILGQATNFDPRPGASNTLEVFAVEETVVVGVNGVPVGTETLVGTDLDGGMGVGLVTGIFPEDQIPGRVIPYENYQVWYLP